MENKNNNKDVVLFFACDDNYIPCFSVVLESIRDHIDINRRYIINVLHSGNISNNSIKKIIQEYHSENMLIKFVDISQKLENICDKLHTRDYYSKSTYFRLFIPNLYPELEKALYLDCDIVLLEDVAKLYDVDLQDNFVGAITDEAVSGVPAFRSYVESRIGVKSYTEYFNAGILLMNLKKLRQINFEDLFVDLLSSVTFTVAQDQDYLNVICKDKILFLDKYWNKMPLSRNIEEDECIKLIHYNLSFKPWHLDGIHYSDIFWNYANKCIFREEIQSIKANYPIEKQKKSYNMLGKYTFYFKSQKCKSIFS